MALLDRVLNLQAAAVLRVIYLVFNEGYAERKESNRLRLRQQLDEQPPETNRLRRDIVPGEQRAALGIGANAAAVIASLIPAVRASRVDVIQALRSE